MLHARNYVRTRGPLAGRTREPESSRDGEGRTKAATVDVALQSPSSTTHRFLPSFHPPTLPPLARPNRRWQRGKRGGCFLRPPANARSSTTSHERTGPPPGASSSSRCDSERKRSRTDGEATPIECRHPFSLFFCFSSPPPHSPFPPSSAVESAHASSLDGEKKETMGNDGRK